jgi:hypothetical protein
LIDLGRHPREGASSTATVGHQSPWGVYLELRFEQSNLTGGVTEEDEQHRAAFEQNWQDMLDKLTSTTEH